MKGRFGDLLRTLWAWWYWNARKTIFVARGRTGRCPCQNNSDIGGTDGVRCDAVLFWKDPGRFGRRVCPLLTRNAKGDWICRVPASEVRPFWGRVAIGHFGLVAVMILVGGLSAWGGMRAVGYRVSLRQIFWPRAWTELRQVRADLFREKALAALSAGRSREAITALVVARQINPGDYASGMMLAQLFHLVQPEAVDALYAQLLTNHPAQGKETARVWGRSMLARANMTGLAGLALARLEVEPEGVPAWTHALITAARWTRNWNMLTAAIDNAKLPAEARAVCALELRLRRADPAGARSILVAEPAPATPYAALHRVERLVEFQDSFEALDLLRTVRSVLAGRDVVRLTLAAHAVGHNRARLERESGSLLQAQGADAAAAVAIIAQHLIRFPDEALLERCREAFGALPQGAVRDDAAAALFCAAALAGKIDWLPEIRKQFSGQDEAGLLAQQRIEERLRGKDWTPLFLLSVVRPVSADLNYAVIERMIAARAAAPVPAPKTK
ncbi:MAG TPA: hypothetical protein VK477_06475 [Acidobacteriota bacterium]|nr:hypothetical protein [Acidobacteriota bacterium]